MRLKGGATDENQCLETAGTVLYERVKATAKGGVLRFLGLLSATFQVATPALSARRSPVSKTVAHFLLLLLYSKGSRFPIPQRQSMRKTRDERAKRSKREAASPTSDRG